MIILVLLGILVAGGVLAWFRTDRGDREDEDAQAQPPVERVLALAAGRGDVHRIHADGSGIRPDERSP